ncbi:MAG TPA: NAD(P)H-hydrate dehydratase [Acidimicrobiales bacterium]|nr:NAD(P)H-hydrate dehydratase [Acidimicrobiales bacterium]
MVEVTPAVLRAWPLPGVGADADKEARGRVAIVGGSDVTPGAVLLAGIAALRAGAGKLRIATAPSAASAVAVAVPEALVSGDDDVERVVEGCDAVLVGTGMLDADVAASRTRRVLDAVAGGRTLVVLDAAAVTGLDVSVPLGPRAIVVPNASEAARLLDAPSTDDCAGLAASLAARLSCTAAVRDADTFATAPECEMYVDRSGNAGLATSGSGDVLAGLLAGLAARGADPLQAVVWAAHVHGLAGDRLAARIGAVGYLARELLDEIPGVLTSLTSPS